MEAKINKPKKIKKPVIKEKFIQDYFIHLARLHGAYICRINNVKITGKGMFVKLKDFEKGHADAILLNKSGEAFFIEFKSSVGKLSEFQKYQQKKITENKGRYVVIASILDCTEFFAINK